MYKCNILWDNYSELILFQFSAVHTVKSNPKPDFFLLGPACRNHSCACWNYSCECRNYICGCQNHTACWNYTLRVEISLWMWKSHSSLFVYKPHSACRNHSCACWNHSCQNHTACIWFVKKWKKNAIRKWNNAQPCLLKSHFAFRNYTCAREHHTCVADLFFVLYWEGVITPMDPRLCCKSSKNYSYKWSIANNFTE
jgi:hypothetical protein